MTSALDMDMEKDDNVSGNMHPGCIDLQKVPCELVAEHGLELDFTWK